MRRRATIAIALFSSLLILLPVTAQGPRGGRGQRSVGPAGVAEFGPGNFGRGRGGGRTTIPSKRVLERLLNFSDEQFAELDVLMKAHRETVEPLHDLVQVMGAQLRENLDSGAADAATVGQLVIDTHGIRAEIAAAQTALREDFRALLTEEQLEILEEFGNRRQRGRRGDKGRGKGNGNNGS